jgi:acyl-CoA thioester hydrolase
MSRPPPHAPSATHTDPHALRPSAQPASVALKVPFHDCDPLFVVWHGRYFEYMEQARCALFARHQVDVEHVRALGYKMYITDARCRYMFPLTYNDEVRIQARFTAVSPLLRVSYEIWNVTKDRKAARAFTVMATTDAASNLLAETPPEILARLREPGRQG